MKFRLRLKEYRESNGTNVKLMGSFIKTSKKIKKFLIYVCNKPHCKISPNIPKIKYISTIAHFQCIFKIVSVKKNKKTYRCIRKYKDIHIDRHLV
ncbi:hypothetical protein BpHYR1_003251 [Brachionus plicatilis]|uniref:Uncharacterized protein n=1 Tax=Brachionus plicatilis TaxID=10195 RepID=A0A3M7Q8X1_BRAPC|nr:hypothetical protein BpHYR1_003251 [Brachionus plicatilis]